MRSRIENRPKPGSCNFSGPKCSLIHRTRRQAVGKLRAQRARLSRLARNKGISRTQHEFNLKITIKQLYGAENDKEIAAIARAVIGEIDGTTKKLNDPKVAYAPADLHGEEMALRSGWLGYTKVASGDLSTIYLTTLFFNAQDTFEGRNVSKASIRRTRIGFWIHEAFQLATKFASGQDERYGYRDMTELARTSKIKARRNPESFACLVMYGHLEYHGCGR